MKSPRLLAVAVSVLLPACAENPATTIETDAGTVTIELLDDGSEPRRRLHYDLGPGSTDKFSMDVKMSMKQTSDAGTFEVDAPRFRVMVSMGPMSRTEDGNLRTQLRFEGTSLADPEARSGQDLLMADMLDRTMKPIKAWLIVTPHGCTVDGGFESSEEIPQQLQKMLDDLRKSLRQMPMIFPEQPVGVGARWRIEMPLDIMGMAVRQTAVYRLLELEGNTGRLGIAMTQEGSGVLEVPDLPPGARAEVESLESEGEGEMTFDLTTLTPTGELNMALSMAFSTEIEDESMDFEMDMRMEMAFRRVE